MGLLVTVLMVVMVVVGSVRVGHKRGCEEEVKGGYSEQSITRAG